MIEVLIILKYKISNYTNIDFDIEYKSKNYQLKNSDKIYIDFGIEDEEIIEAVANHTFGKPGLSNLGILLYVADKIEPGREQVTPEYMERLLKMSLKDMAAFVVKESMDYVSGKKHRLSEATKLFYESLAN